MCTSKPRRFFSVKICHQILLVRGLIFLSCSQDLEQIDFGAVYHISTSVFMFGSRQDLIHLWPGLQFCLGLAFRKGFECRLFGFTLNDFIPITLGLYSYYKFCSYEKSLSCKWKYGENIFTLLMYLLFFGNPLLNRDCTSILGNSQGNLDLSPQTGELTAYPQQGVNSQTLTFPLRNKS